MRCKRQTTLYTARMNYLLDLIFDSHIPSERSPSVKHSPWAHWVMCNLLGHNPKETTNINLKWYLTKIDEYPAKIVIEEYIGKSCVQLI